MKIAIFSDSFYPELSGIADTVLVTGIELARRGHSVEYFVPRYGKKAYAIGNVPQTELDLGKNIKIHRVFSVPVKTPTMQGHAMIPNPFRGFFTKEKFDIVHSHGFFGAGIDALCFAKIKSVPLVGTNHTLIESFMQYFPLDQRGTWIEKCILSYLTWYYGRCNFVSTPSQFLLDDMKAKGLRAASQAISNPVERQFYNSEKSREVLKKELQLRHFNILYAGRISVEKNSETLLRGCMPFLKKHADASLSIVGQGMLREKLEAMAHESDVADQIQFTGPFLGNKKKYLYNFFHASDIFVMPSTSDSQSMCVIQAMASGLPVIAAKAGGPPELIGTERGLLFEPDMLPELAAHLETLYTNFALREKFSVAATAFAKKYSVEAIASVWENEYQRVVQNNTKKYAKHASQN